MYCDQTVLLVSIHQPTDTKSGDSRPWINLNPFESVWLVIWGFINKIDLKLELMNIQFEIIIVATLKSNIKQKMANVSGSSLLNVSSCLFPLILTVLYFVIKCWYEAMLRLQFELGEFLLQVFHYFWAVCSQNTLKGNWALNLKKKCFSTIGWF